MPRLFTALEIPPHVGDVLSMMRGGVPGARWITPENYHLTLRFIGDVDDIAAREAAYALGQIKRPSFEMRLEGLSTFGGKRPRAIIVPAASNRALMELQAEQERLMRRIGLEPEGRKFTPHVTLARLRDASSHEVADYLSARGYFSIPPFQVTGFVLYSSRASSGGGPYIVEADYPLTARPEPLRRAALA